MKRRMIVLRAPNRVPPGAGTRPGSAYEAAEAAVGSRIEIEEDPDRATLEALDRDPTLVAMAPAMPMSLIEPLASCPSRLQNTDVTWGVNAVGATTSNFDGADITVAVLDTGIQADHPAFAGMQLIQRDFTGTGNGDPHGHGTHCAGTIFGRALAGTRIGVAPGVKRACIAKVLGGPSGGGSDVVSEAILWAYHQRAHVISMSLGIDFPGYVESLVQESGFRIRQATSLALDAYTSNVVTHPRAA